MCFVAPSDFFIFMLFLYHLQNALCKECVQSKHTKSKIYNCWNGNHQIYNRHQRDTWWCASNNHQILLENSGKLIDCRSHDKCIANHACLCANVHPHFIYLLLLFSVSCLPQSFMLESLAFISVPSLDPLYYDGWKWCHSWGAGEVFCSYQCWLCANAYSVMHYGQPFFVLLCCSIVPVIWTTSLQ